MDAAKAASIILADKKHGKTRDLFEDFHRRDVCRPADFARLYFFLLADGCCPFLGLHTREALGRWQ